MEIDYCGSDHNLTLAGQTRSDRRGIACWRRVPFENQLRIIHQVTTLDRAKLTSRLGTLSSAVLREVADGLKSGYGSRLSHKTS